MTSEEIKQFALSLGADKCGIATVDRFFDAPAGFNPTDIYPDTKSVVVFLRRMPEGVIKAINPVPYTHTACMLYAELDRIGLEICRYIHKNGSLAVPVPTDVPYISWDEERKHGQGILSMRHAAFRAGLGFLGRNTLLINPELGNLVYIGAILTDMPLGADPIRNDLKCPDKCRICLDACPANALDGITVNQKLCRELSFYKNERGFDMYDCKACRVSCPYMKGMKNQPAA
jgi:epoxyqueuosine reductase